MLDFVNETKYHLLIDYTGDDTEMLENKLKINISDLKKWWFLTFIPIIFAIAIICVVVANGDKAESIANEISNGNFEVAETLLVEYEKSNPSDRQTYELYADLYLAKNEPEMAIKMLEKGLREVSSVSEGKLQERIDSIKSEYDIQEPTESTQIVEKEDKTEEPKNDYVTEGVWALTSNYIFAIENDSFDGDVFQKGTYRFYPTSVTVTDKEIPIVWDIYLSDKLYSSTSQLPDSEYITSVGGWNNDEATLELEKGQYVYIIYNEPASEPTGALRIEKK